MLLLWFFPLLTVMFVSGRLVSYINPWIPDGMWTRLALNLTVFSMCLFVFVRIGQFVTTAWKLVGRKMG